MCFAESKLGKDYMGERVVFDDDDDDQDSDEASSSSKRKKDGKCKHASKEKSSEKESSREKKSKHSKKSAGKSGKKSEKGDRAQKKSKSPKQSDVSNSNINDSSSVSSKGRCEASVSGEKAAFKKSGKKTSHSQDVGTTAEAVSQRSSDKGKSKEERDKCGAAAVRRSPRLTSSACPAAALRFCVCLEVVCFNFEW